MRLFGNYRFSRSELREMISPMYWNPDPNFDRYDNTPFRDVRAVTEGELEKKAREDVDITAEQDIQHE